MRRRVISNFAFVLFANLLVKPAWIFGVDRSIQNHFGPEEYGVYFVLLNFSFLGSFLLDLGLTQYNNRYVSQHAQTLTKQFGHLFYLKVFLGLGYLLLMIFLIQFFNYTASQKGIAYWLFFNQFLLSMATFFRSNLNALQYFKLDGILSIVDKLLVIFLIALIWLLPDYLQAFRIIDFVYIQTFSYLFSCILAFYHLRKFFSEAIFKPKLASLLVVLKYSFPFGLMTVLVLLYSRVDLLLVKLILPENGFLHAGQYAMAFRLLEAFNMFPILLSSILMPIIAKGFKENVDIYPIFKLSVSLLLLCASTIWIGSIIFGKQIMEMLYLNVSAGSVVVFKILMTVFIIYCLNYLFGTMLTASGHLNFLNKLSVLVLLVAIVANTLLIPRFFSLGISIALLCSQCVLFFGHFYKVFVVFKFHSYIKNAVLLIFFFAFIGLMAFIINDLQINFIYKIIISGLLLAMNSVFWFLTASKDLMPLLKKQKMFS